MAILTRRDRRARRGASYCLFQRGGREFGVPTASSRHIGSGAAVRHLADSHPFVAGVSDGPDGPVPLVILDRWFAITPRQYTPADQIIFLQVGDFSIGLVVDRVREVQLVDDTEVRSMDDSAGSAFVRGEWESQGRRIVLLDAQKLIEQVLAVRDSVPGWQPIARSELAPRRIEGSEEFCIFSRGARDLGLPISRARELLSAESLTRVPQSPAHLAGVLNLRGDLLPVVRIDSWLDLPERSFGLTDQIVVIDRQDALVGIIVDRVRDVRTLSTGDIRATDSQFSQNPLYRGTWERAGERITILDADRLVDTVVELAAEGFRRVYSAPGMLGGSVPDGRS